MTKVAVRKISKDIGIDISLAKITVFLFPKVIGNYDLYGLDVANEWVDRRVDLNIILDSYGCPIYPQNLFLHALKSEYLVKNTTTHSQALLLFTRFLSAIGKDYSDICEDPELGVVSLFCDYLIENLKSFDSTKQEIKNENGFSLSTAKVYLNVIVRFYKWMHISGILRWSEQVKPFDISYYLISKSSNKSMLSHMYREKVRVETNSIIKRLPKVQSSPPWRKLKPLSVDDEEIFLRFLNVRSRDVKSLMLLLSLKTGCRLDELITFPDSKVNLIYGTVVMFLIGPENNVRVKNSKSRFIEVDASTMQELYEYKASNERRNNLLKAGISLNTNLQQVSQSKLKNNIHGRLFVSRKGTPYSSNSLETYFYELRNEIRKVYPDWYYRIHDLRSTYATRWLQEKSVARCVSFEFLIDELASLLGHSNTSVTMKYIDFMNRHKIRVEHSLRKNKLSNS